MRPLLYYKPFLRCTVIKIGVVFTKTTLITNDFLS